MQCIQNIGGYRVYTSLIFLADLNIFFMYLTYQYFTYYICILNAQLPYEYAIENVFLNKTNPYKQVNIYKG